MSSIVSILKSRSVFFWLFILLVIIPVVPFLLVSLGMLIYIYWPMGLDDMEIPLIETGVDHVVLISHGLGDTSATWGDPLKETLDARDDGAQVISLDWNPYAQSTVRCSVDGKRLGEALGERFAKNHALRTVHLVAHSCGSFISLGVCQALRKLRSDVSIQSTYLDPVTVYGGLFWEYGLSRFGSCADFSDAYIDTGDRVPGSNQLLPATHTFDVTLARISAGYEGSPHVWPTLYYRRLARNGSILDLRADEEIVDRYPRNVSEAVRK